MEVEFGYYPSPLELTTGDLSVRTLSDLTNKTADVMDSRLIERDWIYAPPAEAPDLSSGVRELPYSSRIFDLPKTHVFTHATSGDGKHVRFLVWVLGFIYGMRFTDVEMGFLDATPIKPRKLHDIRWKDRSEPKALIIAEAYWQKHSGDARVAAGILGILHTLFLSQRPNLLEFETLNYLYTSIDGCHAVWSYMSGQNPLALRHFERIPNLCKEMKRQQPDWADRIAGPDEVRLNRNHMLHEGLLLGEPLGYQIYGGNQRAASDRNILLELQNLVSRAVCHLIGFNDASYITSALDMRMRFPVKL